MVQRKRPRPPSVEAETTYVLVAVFSSAEERDRVRDEIASAAHLASTHGHSIDPLLTEVRLRRGSLTRRSWLSLARWRTLLLWSKQEFNDPED